MLVKEYWSRSPCLIPHTINGTLQQCIYISTWALNILGGGGGFSGKLCSANSSRTSAIPARTMEGKQLSPPHFDTHAMATTISSNGAIC